MKFYTNTFLGFIQVYDEKRWMIGLRVKEDGSTMLEVSNKAFRVLTCNKKLMETLDEIMSWETQTVEGIEAILMERGFVKTS